MATKGIPDMISIASPFRYNFSISLEIVVYFVCKDAIKGNLIVESCEE